MRLALYARVSTQDQDCAQQLTALREYAAARQWPVAGGFVDTISGSQDKRPAMDRLMADARQRKIDAIAVWKIDRWGRSMPHFVSSVQELASLGVRFIAITQGIDTDSSNPASRLMLNLLAAFAEFERELIIERTKAGLQRARAEGRIGGRPRKIVSHKKVESLRAEGQTLRQIAAAVGVSPAKVMRILQSTP
jgi:DNA invertase Pin-like site-specific DNA recombinase